MPAGNAYPSGHLVPFPILGLANAPIVKTKFLELAMSLFDFSPRIPLGTFSNLLSTSPVSSVGTASGFRSQGCGFDSNCGQEMFILYFVAFDPLLAGQLVTYKLNQA